MPTADIERHEPPRQRYRLTELPGSLEVSQEQQTQLLSGHDLIIFVFRVDKEKTRQYYRDFWDSEPPVPVVMVGTSPGKADENTGKKLKSELQRGTLCDYFPVALNEKETFQQLSLFLESQTYTSSWHKPSKEDAVGGIESV
jgi:hypothetical protein